MEFDSLGLLFIALSLMFLIAVLFGHQRREHMSNQISKWDSIRQNVEDQLKEKYDFNISEFRKNVSDQKDFFVTTKGTLEKYSRDFGIQITLPEVKDMKNTDKPFDERFRLIDEDGKSMREFAKKNKEKLDKTVPFDLYVDTMIRDAKTFLIQQAKMYMIFKSGSVSPKTALSTISKIIG